MVSEGNFCKKVCVIGAGPAGLVAARELKRAGHEVVVIEQRHEVGGQWLYDPKVEEEHPMGKTRLMKVHSSVYASLRVMSPREIMGFSDFPFVGKKGRDTRRFPGHEEILLYLKDFCDHFGLREMIRFNTFVENVEMLDYPVLEKEHLKWVVKSRVAEKEVEEVYDAVVVASGHYTLPRLPAIEGKQPTTNIHK